MDLEGFEVLSAVALGLGLAAAAGFRVFVPLLLAGLAARVGHLPLAAGFGWLDDTLVLVVLAVAALLEVAAYFIPWFDNLLDAAAAPAAVTAGVLLMAAALVDYPTWLQWTLAVIAGGGTAGLLHGALAGLRLGSTVTTGGLANPAMATFETGAATALTVIAVMVPLLSVAVVVFMISRSVRLITRRRRA